MTDPKIMDSSGVATDAPLISLVVPCYNGERYLELAMESIFSQDYPNYEVIVVDDGSTDNSIPMLEALQQRHPFQLIRQANQGVSAALNNGLRHAQGIYVATPDLDDIMLSDSLSVRARYLDEHPDVGLVAGLLIYIDPDGHETKRQSTSRLVKLDFDEMLRKAIVMPAPVSLYRMEALRAVDLYDPAIRVQDFQISLRIAHRGYQVHALPVHVTRYRRHPENLSRKFKVMLEADMRTIEPYRSHPDYERGRTAILNKALKYAVIHDKKYAWTLLRSIPMRQFNKTTLRRVRRLMLHRQG